MKPDSPKERWLLCYEQAQDEMGPMAALQDLYERADELFQEMEGQLVDEAFERWRDRELAD